MNKTIFNFLLVFIFLFSCNLLITSTSYAFEDRIGRPKNVTEEQISELKNKIISNVQNALTLVEQGDSKQIMNLLKSVLRDINTLVVWTKQTGGVVAPNTQEGRKRIKEAIKDLKKGDLEGVQFSLNAYLTIIGEAVIEANRSKISRPKDITKEDIAELAGQIVSNLQEALDSIEADDRTQAIKSLKLALKDINTIAIWEELNLVELPEDARASKKQIRQAIKLIRKGTIDKAKDLIGSAVVIWTNEADALVPGDVEN